MFNTTYDTGFQSTAERSQTLLTTQPALLDVRTRYLCHDELEQSWKSVALSDAAVRGGISC